MKFRQLEYFCAVAEEKSISAAARELHVAQPPISRQIAQLEEELGVSIFERRTPDISATRRELDWAPRTPLIEGLRRTISYVEKELAEKNYAGISWVEIN